MTTERQPLEDISLFKMVIFHGHVSFLEGMPIQDLPFVLGLNNYPPGNSSWTHLPPLERQKIIDSFKCWMGTTKNIRSFPRG